MEDEECFDTWILFKESIQGPVSASFNTKAGLAKLNRDEKSDRLEDTVARDIHRARMMLKAAACPWLRSEADKR